MPASPLFVIVLFTTVLPEAPLKWMPNVYPVIFVFLTVTLFADSTSIPISPGPVMLCPCPSRTTLLAFIFMHQPPPGYRPDMSWVNTYSPGESITVHPATSPVVAAGIGLSAVVGVC